MLRVAHFLDRYPLKEQGYIFDQIVISPSRSDRVLAAQYFANGLGESLGHDVSRLLSLPSFVHKRRAVTRIWDRLTERSFMKLYRRHLTAAVMEDLKRKPTDILHAHFGTAAVKLTDVRRRTGIPLVTTFYGVDASACIRDPHWIKQYKNLFETGDLFIVLSDAVVDRLAAVGCPRTKLAVWDIGIDIPRFKIPERHRKGALTKLLCVARFVEKKGHPILLEAFNKLVKSHPAMLTLIGYGPLLPEITRLVEKFGLQSSVQIMDTQHRSDFNELFPRALAEHDIFVFASIVASDGDDEAGLALTMLSAQAAGMPVVTTRYVGSERSIVDGETGVYCDPQPDSLADKISQLIANPLRAREIGRLASDFVGSNFAWPQQLEKMQALYQQLIDKQSLCRDFPA